MLSTLNLQSATMDGIFGAGNCVCFEKKLGVNLFARAGAKAVCQALVLIHSILTFLQRHEGGRGCKDRGRAVEYTSQESFGSLIVKGDWGGIGASYGVAFKGHWLWLLKSYVAEEWTEKLGIVPTESYNAKNCARDAVVGCGHSVDNEGD